MNQIHCHIPFIIVEHNGNGIVEHNGNGILLSQTELKFHFHSVLNISVLGSRNQDQSTVHFSGGLATVTTFRVLVPGVNFGVLLVIFGPTSAV